MKRYAERRRRLERRDVGADLLTAVAMVPESQLWTLEEPNRSRIARGLEWAAANQPKETDVEALRKVQPNRARRGRTRRR